MKLNCLCEDTLSSVFRRFVQYLRKDPAFGPGVDPKNWGEVKELVEAKGLPKINFEQEWDKAVSAENTNAQKALKIYKNLADKHPLSGLRSKSYFKRSKEENRLYVVIDIDNLKYINSKLGHKGADTVLRKFGELLEKHVEKHINQKFGAISKTFHRSGDEFNAIIDLGTTPKDIIKYTIEHCEKLLQEFSGIEFRSEIGTTRASATIGLGLDEVKIDQKVDLMKKERRKISLFGKMHHLIIDDDVKELIK